MTTAEQIFADIHELLDILKAPPGSLGDRLKLTALRMRELEKQVLELGGTLPIWDVDGKVCGRIRSDG